MQKGQNSKLQHRFREVRYCITYDNESYMCGKAAAKYAMKDMQERWSACQEVKERNIPRNAAIDLDDVANKEKKVPLEWINRR